MKKVVLFLSIIISLVVATGCDSHSKEIDEIKEVLLWKDKGKSGSWRMSYNYYFTDDIDLTAVETLKLQKDGTFKEETIYSYENSKLAKVSIKGTWDIEYDDDLDAFFFIQNYEGTFDITNIGMDKQWFKRFDTDIRLVRNGDAYSSIDDDENTLYGLEIIDYKKDLFLIKSLSTKSVYRYEPVRGNSAGQSQQTSVAQSHNTTNTYTEEVGDAPDEERYYLSGKVDGKYPVEIEVTAIEGQVNWARCRYTSTGSGEWINMEVDTDDMGRTLLYEVAANGDKAGCFTGRFSVTGSILEYEGWHKNFKTGKERTFALNGSTR